MVHLLSGLSIVLECISEEFNNSKRRVTSTQWRNLKSTKRLRRRATKSFLWTSRLQRQLIVMHGWQWYTVSNDIGRDHIPEVRAILKLEMECITREMSKIFTIITKIAIPTEYYKYQSMTFCLSVTFYLTTSYQLTKYWQIRK